MLQKYIYEGPVTMFGTCICDYWFGETTAVTPAKAKSNLIYRFKKENDMAPYSKLELPGEIKIKE